MLKRLLTDEIKLVAKRNLVAGRAFSEILASSVLRYQRHALDTAAVVAEFVALAKQLKHEHERGAELGVREDEVAFYDAICQNDSAVLEMGDHAIGSYRQPSPGSGRPAYARHRSAGARPTAAHHRHL